MLPDRALRLRVLAPRPDDERLLLLREDVVFRVELPLRELEVRLAELLFFELDPDPLLRLAWAIQISFLRL